MFITELSKTVCVYFDIMGELDQEGILLCEEEVRGLIALLFSDTSTEFYDI